MATRSILKQVTINKKRNCEMLVNALESAAKQKEKEIIAPKPFVAKAEDIKKMAFAGK